MSDQEPTARWRSSGPDPDQPPWAGRDRDEEDASATDPADETEPSEEEAEGVGQVAGGPGSGDQTMLEARRGAGATIPRPPKRTGVFLDADDLRVHVGELLRAMLGGYQVDAWGNYTFTHEDARVFVTVGQTPIGPQVGVFSITNVDIELTPDLAAFLLATNHKLGFGSFSYDPVSSSVWLRHTLLGTTIDGPELQTAVAAIASTAADVDDAIRDRFGGRAFHDAPEDVQSQAKPPAPEDQQTHPNASGYL
jgi:hypothetical protein